MQGLKGEAQISSLVHLHQSRIHNVFLRHNKEAQMDGLGIRWAHTQTSKTNICICEHTVSRYLIPREHSFDRDNLGTATVSSKDSVTTSEANTTATAQMSQNVQ